MSSFFIQRRAAVNTRNGGQLERTEQIKTENKTKQEVKYWSHGNWLYHVLFYRGFLLSNFLPIGTIFMDFAHARTQANIHLFSCLSFSDCTQRGVRRCPKPIHRLWKTFQTCRVLCRWYQVMFTFRSTNCFPPKRMRSIDHCYTI